MATFYKCVLWIVYGAAISLTADSTEISLSMTNPRAFPGMETDLVCLVTPYTAEVADKITWVKRYGHIEKQVSIKTTLLSEFLSTERYSVFYDVYQAPGTNVVSARFHLKIRNLRPEDAGHIGCVLPSLGLSDFKQLVVYSPVVEMDVDLRNGDGVIVSGIRELPVKHGDTVELNCHVRGGFPSPEVRVFLGKEEITRLFERRENLVLEGDTVGLQKQTYSVSMLGGRLNIGHYITDQKLLCVADIPGTILPPIREYSFKLEG